MGNCIPKINKDCFFAVEELMKNRFGLDMLTGGDIYKAPLHKENSRKKFAPLQTGVW